MSFSEKLKNLRVEHGDTQSALATKLNVSQNAVYNWENGKREPNLETILKIADIYDVSTDYLMGLDNKDDLIVNYNLGGLPDILENYTQEVGEFLYHNPTHKQLFDASMEVREKDVSLATEMLNRINGKTIELDHESKKEPEPHRRDDPEMEL